MPFVFSYLLEDVSNMKLASRRAIIYQVYSYGSNVARQTAVLSDWYAVRLSEMVLGRRKYFQRNDIVIDNPRNN